MKKIIKYNTAVLLVLMFIVFGCKKEDFTDYSTLKTSSPTVTITVNNSNITLLEQDSVFTFDVTLSEAQVSDVALYITVLDGGTATLNEDFSIENTSNKVVIEASKTTGSAKIKVLADELEESTETFSIQIGDDRTSNVSITYATVNFTITNSVEPELTMDLSWETDVLDAIGDVGLDPDKVVDLRLLIIDPITDTIVLAIDGETFESFGTLTDTLNDGLPGKTYLADGNYIIAVDVFSTVDFGDLNAPVTLDLTLEFNQAGVINGQVMSFPAVMTNANVCDLYRTYLATVTKSGSTFTLTEAISYMAPDNSDLAGEWNGIDAETVYTLGETSQAVTRVTTDGSMELMGLGFGWMLNFWGEIVIDSAWVELQVNWCAGELTIPDQYTMTTTYDGVEQDPYNVAGTGTFDVSGAFPTITLNYELTNFETGWAAWCYANGYISTPLFVATITLDPDGKVVNTKTNMPFNLEELKPRH